MHSRFWILAIVATCSLAVGVWVISANQHVPQVSQAEVTLPPTAAPTVAPTAAPTPQPTVAPSLTLTFGGDVMLGRWVERGVKAHSNTWPLESVAATVRQSDISVVNLESPLRTDATTTEKGSLVLRGYPPAVATLTDAGIDLVSLANNHITDMGLAGLRETQITLDSLDIAHPGAGESDAAARAPVVLERNGVKVAFLSVTYGVNFNSTGVYYARAKAAQVAEDVAAARKQADVVVLLCHWGTEYAENPGQAQKDVAHAAIDAGAALVIGAHSHVPQPVEQYGGGLIIYSLGNLVFDQTPSEFRDRSALAQVTLTNGHPSQLKLLPYQIYDYGQPRLLSQPTDQEPVWNRFKVPGGSLSFAPQ